MLQKLIQTLTPLHGVAEARAIVYALLEDVFGLSKTDVLLGRFEGLSATEKARFKECAARLSQGEPLQYVVGTAPFGNLTFEVTPATLIPRPETELLCRTALEHIRERGVQSPKILDLCTGSGCIGLAIASRVKDAKVTLADLSREALAVARKNVALHHMSGRVSCVQVDAMAEPPAFLGQFDMIVSNPPYIDRKDMEGLEVSVKDFEPHMALFGGNDGLDFYRAITANYRHNLKPGGYLCYEFGEDQGDDVCDILAANGFTVRQRVKDFCGTERAVIAQYCVEE